MLASVPRGSLLFLPAAVGDRVSVPLRVGRDLVEMLFPAFWAALVGVLAFPDPMRDRRYGFLFIGYFHRNLPLVLFCNASIAGE